MTEYQEMLPSNYCLHQAAKHSVDFNLLTIYQLIYILKIYYYYYHYLYHHLRTHPESES